MADEIGSELESIRDELTVAEEAAQDAERRAREYRAKLDEMTRWAYGINSKRMAAERDRDEARRQLEEFKAAAQRVPCPGSAVYIAEVVWFADNPVDGRQRVAVCTSLNDALHILRRHEIHGGDLVATETTSALGSSTARTWAVHERDEEPSDEGFRWITSEMVTQ